MFFPSNLIHTIYTGQAANSGPSPKLWSQIRASGISPDGFARGYYAGDEFMGFGIGTAVAANVGYYVGDMGTYKSFEDTSSSITAVAGTGGQITLATPATDNLECWLQYNSLGGTLGAINTTSPKLTVFEARVKFPTVSAGNAFVGLGEEAFAANNAITDGGDMADKDLFGFLLNEDDPDALTIVYGKAGGTAAPTVLATYGNLTADTFYNVGFIYNPFATAAKRITFYINNTKFTTYGTSSTLADADFPLGEEMTFLTGVKNNGAAIKSITVDWWHWWQEA
jgi:hypothetical protein